MKTRVNGRIKAPEVRVIWEEGSEVGVFSISHAFAWVARIHLDLIEIGPWSAPPICLAIDYGMYRWNLAQAAKYQPAKRKLVSRKRGCQLPKGCKDLLEVLQPAAKPPPEPATPAKLPPIVGELTVAGQMTIGELSLILKHRPTRIIADLLTLGIAPLAPDQELGFGAIALVARKFGYTVKPG
jgi:hypothetical protein